MDNNILGKLEQQSSDDFRKHSIRVGAIYTINYDSAVVAVFDYNREEAGGLPVGGFLLAAKKEGDQKFILLRILGEARLPNTEANNQIRQQGIEDTGNEDPWSKPLDPWTRDRLSLHGLECRVLGTFTVKNGKYGYAEDTDNYYSVHELMVWKPDETILEVIVNYKHRSNQITMESKPSAIGHTRFAASESPNAIRAKVLLNPTDLLRRRTVYLGMSRSGKSNAMKITAERIYKLRQEDKNNRVGQLIFDPNGEYAQNNPQDGLGLHEVHKSINLTRDAEVETYGLFVPPTDPKRTIMKINFFGEQFPPLSQASIDDIEEALSQMLTGREIIIGAMSDEGAKYTKAFRDADLSIPNNIKDFAVKTRYKRAVLVYQTALFEAGFAKPEWKPSIQGLFNQKIIAAMTEENNQKSDNQNEYSRTASILSEHSKSYEISWEQLLQIFHTLNKFIADSESGYKKFNEEYITPKSDDEEGGEAWADARLTSLLQIFNYSNGPRTFQSVQNQHEPNSPNDFAVQIMDDLKEGKLVIVDQSTGDPKQNEKAAERIMWKIFNAQQDLFRSGIDTNADGSKNHILVYLEEAHNLLPKSSGGEGNLRTVWARAAKEGSKMNLGMVLATQAPSSIMPEILSETDNWILAYLNSENERKIISGYMDFGDFIKQIGQVSEPGFVRIRTLSLAYTIPMQFAKFELKISETSK